jgi:N-acetylmuramoyl-L-alanine amidase
MRKSILFPFFFAAILGVNGVLFYSQHMTQSQGAPPYDVGDEVMPESFDPYAYLKNWKRPDGPPRVGLQVGHWKNEELPQELERLVGSTGSKGGGKAEWEVNLAIAQATEQLLKEKGIQVDILPATVPEAYWADVFVAIHADGNEDSRISGFKLAAPRRDFTGKAEKLVTKIESSYEDATGLATDTNVSRNMRGYYAFAFWRYKHAVHPMTVSTILETGFLTNSGDRTIIVSRPQLSAKGLATGISDFLQSEGLL